jgi:hypothetical protein
MSTYAQLKQDIADWLNRNDLTDQIPVFIRLAEARLNRELRVRQMIKRAVSFTDSNDNYVTLPGDWLEARHIRVGVNGKLEALEYFTLEDIDKGQRSLLSGRPRYFNLIGNRLQIFPEPPNDTEVEMVYYGRIPALSSQETSNWLLAEWPDVYLYGALMHTAPYLKDDERTAVWASLYSSGIEEIRLSDARAKHSSFSLRSRPKSFG